MHKLHPKRGKMQVASVRSHELSLWWSFLDSLTTAVSTTGPWACHAKKFTRKIEQRKRSSADDSMYATWNDQLNVLWSYRQGKKGFDKYIQGNDSRQREWEILSLAIHSAIMFSLRHMQKFSTMGRKSMAENWWDRSWNENTKSNNQQGQAKLYFRLGKPSLKTTGDYKHRSGNMFHLVAKYVTSFIRNQISNVYTRERRTPDNVNRRHPQAPEVKQIWEQPVVLMHKPLHPFGYQLASHCLSIAYNRNKFEKKEVQEAHSVKESLSRVPMLYNDHGMFVFLILV